jgi:hypothetical protein
MPIPAARHVARFNRRFGNRILGPITWWLPGFGQIEHRGRVTGRTHRAPMLAFPSSDGRRLVFAPTYGPEAEWVRNVLVSGEVGWLTRRGGKIRLVEPRLVHDPARTMVPPAVRLPLRILRVDDFLVATIATAPARPPGQTATAER